jgi:hypothetical protein
MVFNYYVCATEKQAGQLRAMDWNEAFEGIKTREPNYRIVVKGMPIDNLDLDDPETITYITQSH